MAYSNVQVKVFSIRGKIVEAEWSACRVRVMRMWICDVEREPFSNVVNDNGKNSESPFKFLSYYATRLDYKTFSEGVPLHARPALL